MPANGDPPRDEVTVPLDRYYYRRELALRELIPAVGVGVAAGLCAFYVARVLFERTPLLEAPRRSAADGPDAARRIPPVRGTRGRRIRRG